MERNTRRENKAKTEIYQAHNI